MLIITYTIQVAINNGIYHRFWTTLRLDLHHLSRKSDLGIRTTLESQCPAARCLWGVIPHCPKF